MNKVTGGSLPVDIWHDYMQEALQGQPAIPIPVPDGTAPLLLASSDTAPAATTASATASDSDDQPGLLDRLVSSILGGGSDDSSSGAGSAAPARANKSLQIWQDPNVQSNRRSK
jgi:penicillin-binding protein 1A